VKAEALHVNSEQQSTLRCMEIEKSYGMGKQLHTYNDS